MIAVTNLHGRQEYVNAELIERIQSNPDTQVVLTNGQRIYVREQPELLVERIVAYRCACAAPSDANDLISSERT